MEYGAKQNRAWRLWTDAVESCLREIHLAPAIIDHPAFQKAALREIEYSLWLSQMKLTQLYGTSVPYPLHQLNTSFRLLVTLITVGYIL